MNIQLLKLIITNLILLQCIQIVISDNSLCSGCKIDNDNKCVIDTELPADSNKECSNKYCKPNKSDEKCYDCSSVIISSQSKYYFIKDGICRKIDSNSDCKKIIIETNQCVDTCSRLEFGDFCYNECYSSLGLSEENASTDRCNCADGKYLIEENINGKTYKRCVDSCPFGYHDINTNKCVEKCEGSTNKITQGNGCTNMCEDDQYLFKQTENINGVEITKLYCVSKCPDEARFYYKNSMPNQEKECLPECKEGDFYSIDNDNKYECLDSCNNRKNIDLSAKIFQCKTPSENEQCEEPFPYEYKNSCFRDCSDTQKLEIFGNKKTYFLEYKVGANNKKFCSEECNEDSLNTYFKNSNTLSCHLNCKETSNKFIFNNECVESCDSLHLYYLNDNDKCVEKCEDANEENDNPGDNNDNGDQDKENTNEDNENANKEYYLLPEEKTCYKEPPKGTECKYIDIENKVWNTCNIPKDPKHPKYGEGYIYNNKCYKSCKNIAENPHFYYIINDNICIEDCEKNGGIYKYTIGDTTGDEEDDKQYICYSSCKDIPDNYIYEYGFKCYRQEQSPPGEYSEYFYVESGIKKYFKKTDNNYPPVEDCSKLGLYYLKENFECVKDCSPEEYRELFSTDESGKVKSLGKCLGSNCSTYLFLLGNQKICFENCPYKEIIYEGSDSSENKENCVIQCPSEYPYESFDGKVCKKNCDDTQYFIENEGKKLCVPNCKDYSKFYFDGDKMCVDQCIKQINGKNYYYYYNSDNKCLEKCIGNEENGKDIEFALKADNSPQRCIENCSGLDKHKYYFNENKICLNKCINGFIKSEGETECVSSCNDTSKPFVVNNITCSDACPETEPFIAQVTFGLSTIKKCTSNCELENSIYKFHHCKEEDGKKICECLQSCGTVLYEFGKECLDNCPPGFYKESNKCLTKCSSKYFFKNETTGVYECKESCDGDNKYITSNNECVSRCPIDENFIGADDVCKSKCDPNIDGEYYHKFYVQEETTQTPKYNIYKCLKECNNERDFTLILDGTKECISECTDEAPYKSEDEKVCYSTCLKSTDYPFTEENEKKCLRKCPDNAQYYKEDKVCIQEECKEFKKLVNIKDNSCVNKCDITTQYKYSNGTHCIDNCNKYTINDYICYDGKECPKPYNYISGSICSDKCPENEFANPIYVTNDGVESVNEYTCKSSCDSGLYTYYNTKICLKECGTNQYEVQDEKKCVDSCNEVSTNEKPYFFYEKKDENSPFKKNTCVLHCPDDKPYIDIDNHCSENCSFAGYKYYLYSNKTCVDKCPTGYKKNGLECVLECPQNTEEEKYLYLDETYTCIESCEGSKGGYYYFYKTDRKCLKKCNDNDFMNNFECVSSCPEDSSYIYKQKCLDICPSNQNYYIVFENGEHKTNKYCNSDCTMDYQFYVEKENGNYECQSLCSDYYFTNKDPNIIAKKCVSSCKYYVNINQTHKECFDLCPNGKRYYVNEGEDINQCYEKCPQETPYHIKDNFQCLKKCDSKFVNETNGECISSCGISNRFWVKKKLDDNEEITVCLKNCSEVNLKYYTPEGECNDACDDTKFLKGIKKDNEFICECMNLYYFNDEGVKTCFNNETLKCGEKGKDSENYPYQVDGTNQCVKNCLGVLSPAEDICYLGTSINEKDICPPNTEKGIFDNKIKCDCKYKYYLDENDNKKICLNENEKCPTEYNYLVQDKNECVKSCDGYNIVFDNKCLENCPVGMDEENTENGKSCKCRKYWFKELENKYTCVEQCNDKYPYLIEETNECVKNCNETKYNIMHNNKCISSCGENMTVVQLDDGKTSCLCNYLWIEGGECKKDNKEKNCTDLDENMIYLIKKTNQCVKNCPEGYNYFNHECFSSCNEANNYGYDLEEKSNSKECVCKKFWKYNDENLKVCVEECGDNEFLMNSTSQCIVKSENFKCPHDSPYFYNNICYSKCPESTSIDNIIGDACICNNKWFKKDDELINCFEKEEENCPEAYPYLINITKECVKSEDNCTDQNYPKIFNYVCYSNCPFSTKDNNNKCECDNTKLHWYIDIPNQENPREYYTCNVEKCPNERKYYINGTNECISKCSDRELYEYSNICYDQCPLLTTKSKNGYTCEFSTEAETIKDLVGNISEKIVDLYPELSENGLVINNEEASLQIYGLKNGQDKKEAIKRSNLAFLDLSGCLEKIYKSNHMNGDDEIIVIKLDLKSKNTKLIINPVEYQFIHSRTGEILDASVCEKNEVVISYPITYLLKTKKKLRNLEISEEEQEEILDKFNKGKLIYEGDNSIDTFNYNSSIYTDICIPVEIEGKDLALEDRINYLFPNYSLCESICIYDYTDFIDERIYCNCSIKSEIDVDREQPVKLVQINKNETDNNQKGPTNLPVLKCISNAKIPGNGAFYFCLIIIIVEVGLLVLVILYSFSSLVRKVKKRIIKNNGGDIYSSNNNNVNNIEYNESESDKINKGRNNKFNNYMNDKKTIIKSTDRNLNNQNPPKRRSEEEKDEELNIDDNPINVNKNVYKNDVKEKNVKIDEKNNYDVFSERVDNNIDLDQYLRNNGIETEKGFLFSMREEVNLLRTNYKYSLKNDKFDSIVVVLTSVFDKIYFIRILLLPGKFEIIPLMFSLFLLCHMMLLTFLGFFYDIKTIKKIWNEENYPNTGYYLLYGFLANLIVWVIYRLFCCLLNNEYKIKKLDNISQLDKDKKKKKISNCIYNIKRNIIIYFVLQFVLIMFCSFYLITFCGIYTGTKSKLFQSYGIAFIEIIIIKIIYGFILGILRKLSLAKESTCMYKLILIFNQYLS